MKRTIEKSALSSGYSEIRLSCNPALAACYYTYYIRSYVLFHLINIHAQHNVRIKEPSVIKKKTV